MYVRDGGKAFSRQYLNSILFAYHVANLDVPYVHQKHLYHLIPLLFV